MSHWRLHPRLPIFAVSDGSTHAAYVPCHVMPASPGTLAGLGDLWSDGTGKLVPSGAAAALVEAAEEVSRAWEHRCSPLFEPVCLNVQFPYDCDLDCAYCYARNTGAAPGLPGILNRGAVGRAADFVAGHCRTKDVPFHLVIQGSGEPAMRWDDLQWCVRATRLAAAAASVSWSGHLSTNGQIDIEQAGWIGRTFDHVTVSCDGPPCVQDVVRARRDGMPSSARLAPAVAAIAAGGASVEVRVTITEANAGRLPEVVRYLASDLGIREIRLELVFGQPEMLARLPEPAELARCCLEACRVGVGLEADVSFASPRLAELHGTYCEAPRQVLRLAPDGRAVNCLLGVCAGRAQAVALGSFSLPGGALEVDQEAVAGACRAASVIPSECADCINIYHCARTCPDACPGTDDSSSLPCGAAHPQPDAMDMTPQSSRLPLVGGLRSDVGSRCFQSSYRCLFQQCLAEDAILETARKSPDGQTAAAGAAEPVAFALKDEVTALPDSIDRDSILEDSLRAARYYALDNHEMAAPGWADPDRCITGEAAQSRLFRESAGRTGAISVYVHLPFCRRRCVFCDCHSVVAGRESAARYREYVERLVHDLDVWCLRGGMAGRCVTTVHFGGGTPDVAGYELLDELMRAIRGRLKVHPGTEWAIETSSQGSAPECVAQLMALGFRRLHVGVQTLDENLRRGLGRVSSPKQVLDRLDQAMSQGIVTSVDLLYGLPGQTAASLLADIEDLMRIGTHGFSLYRLNLSSRNQGLFRRFADFRQNPLRECVMLQAAEQRLLQEGYGKNHHVHYALPADENAYFRHALRGEDLLAIGASASGCVGPIEYVCAKYPQYMKWAGAGLPLDAIACQGLLSGPVSGLFRSLMCGEAPARAHVPAAVMPLWDRWLEAGLLVESQDRYRLTALGAWLLAPMLSELQESPENRALSNAQGNDSHI